MLGTLREIKKLNPWSRIISYISKTQANINKIGRYESIKNFRNKKILI